MAKKKTVVIDDSIKAPAKEKAVEAAPSKRVQTKKEERVRGKKYIEARNKVNPNTVYPPEEAVKLAKETSTSSFGGSIQLHLVLKKGSTNVLVDLPHSAGRAKKVEIASDVTVEKVKMGKIDFDVLIAHPSMMPKLVPYARVLGPKGLMPNPKNGTVSEKPEETVQKFGGNTLQVKSEAKAPLVHTIIGKVNQPEKELVENFQAIVSAVGPKAIEKAVVAASMGPGIKVSVA